MILGRASRKSVKIGLVLGILHLFYSWIVFYNVSQSSDSGQLAMVWVMFFGLIDFPILVIHIYSTKLIGGLFDGMKLAMFFYGALAPAIYLMMPIAISHFKSDRKSLRRNN
jgi:hypothetical protein